MKLHRPNCPKCGEPAIGTVERIHGVALFNGDPAAGAVEYGGSTDIWWDEQHSVMRRDKTEVVCDDGHSWFTKIEE